MSFIIDTNVLLYAVNENCKEHALAKKLIEDSVRRTQPWYLTWPIIYEFLRVVTHHKVFPKPLSAKEGWAFIKAILLTEVVSVLTETDRHQTSFEQIVAQHSSLQGNIFHDLHTAVLMAEHGVRRIYTNDTDFLRFKFLEVVNPWSSSAGSE